METVIRTQHLFKTYNPDAIPVHAVRDVSIEIKKGEFTSLVGPSGSGKTTLLNLMGGLDQPTQGTVEVNGRELSTLKPGELIDFRLHNIGFVFQSFNLIPVLTARENIGFVMLLQKQPREARERRISELLLEVGLPDKGASRPAELSGGQQQRVAVARALATRPQFVLADEPTANLDSVAAGQLLDVMEKLNRNEHMTFVFSTHDPRVISRARRVITLEDGRVVADETRS
jgi:putative ABC transport system ATP-binding protein